MSSRLLRATVSSARHWPLDRRHSISVTLRLAAGRSQIENLPVAMESAEISPAEIDEPGGIRILEGDFDVFEGSLSLRHAWKLWESRQGPVAELFWENTFDAGREEASSDLGLPASALDRWSVGSALTWRGNWGVLRIGIAYLDLGRAL